MLFVIDKLERSLGTVRRTSGCGTLVMISRSIHCLLRIAPVSKASPMDLDISGSIPVTVGHVPPALIKPPGVQGTSHLDDFHVGKKCLCYLYSQVGVGG